jgi:flagellar motility protein MotE (MotC chaperone)
VNHKAVLYSAQAATEHLKNEEEHNESKHQFLKDLANLDNKYKDLEAKYKDKEKELVDAEEKLKLTQEEKD